MPSMLCYVSVLVARAAVASPPDWVVSTTDLFFFGILEAGSLRSRCWHNWALVRAVFLVYRQPPSQYPLIRHTQGESKFSGLFL